MLYTDGLPEATDVQSEAQFGDEGLAVLNPQGNREFASLRGIGWWRPVTAFSGGLPLEDDWTLMVREVR